MAGQESKSMEIGVDNSFGPLAPSQDVGESPLPMGACIRPRTSIASTAASSSGQPKWARPTKSELGHIDLKPKDQGKGVLTSKKDPKASDRAKGKPLAHSKA